MSKPMKVVPTDEMCDSVRGILQVIRLRPGVTYLQVKEHCIMRGDNLSLWPQWATTEQGYVTESGAASLIFSVMQAAAPQ